jgi:very-short-patch-repair endonuclease
MPRLFDRTKYRARQLRREMTDAERRLWKHLRNDQLGGCTFRRQHPIPPYVADFACVDARVVVEVDGGQHADSHRDAARDAFLVQHGWRVLRFWNNDVLANTEGVLLQILAALAPTPTLPRADARERE